MLDATARNIGNSVTVDSDDDSGGRGDGDGHGSELDGCHSIINS